MPFTAEELTNINNSALENFLERGTVFKQNVANKPMLKAFDVARGTFSGGNTNVSLGVKGGQGGGSLSGYSHDDQVGYYTPANNKRVKFPWKEHHIGITITHTELKTDGIEVIENGSDQSTSMVDGREEHALANLYEEKLDELGEDYAYSLDDLIHGDGSTDTKALAGIQSLILASPAVGTTGGLSRITNAYWRNRAATAAFAAAGGQGAITSNTAAGGALLQFLQKEKRQLQKFAQGGVRHRCFAGSDFIDAMEKELRANGAYSQNGFNNRQAVNGAMDTMEGVPFGDWTIVYDPTMDRLGHAKRLNVIDMRRVKLLYMNGQRMKKHNPARPYDRYVMYNGITTTAVMVAQQLNTSGVYDIA